MQDPMTKDIEIPREIVICRFCQYSLEYSIKENKYIKVSPCKLCENRPINFLKAMKAMHEKTTESKFFHFLNNDENNVKIANQNIGFIKEFYDDIHYRHHHYWHRIRILNQICFRTYFYDRGIFYFSLGYLFGKYGLTITKNLKKLIIPVGKRHIGLGGKRKGLTPIGKYYPFLTDEDLETMSTVNGTRVMENEMMRKSLTKHLKFILVLQEKIE